MSAHHDDHHSAENKPVSFTVPFILACVTLLILVAFLSLCDPKKGHHGECQHEGQCTEECMNECKKDGHEMKECEHQEEAKSAATHSEPVATDSSASTEPAAEAKQGETKH